MRARYEARQKVQGGAADMTPYEAAIDHDNERAARALIDCADVVIILDDVSPSVVVEIMLRDSRVPNI